MVRISTFSLLAFLLTSAVHANTPEDSAASMAVRADPSTYVTYSSRTYGHDKNAVYANFSDPTTHQVIGPLPLADLATFAVYPDNPNYAHDKNHVYFCGRILPQADPATFEITDPSHARDKNQTYYNPMGYEFADPATLVDLEPFYKKDAKMVYYLHAPFPAADAPSFRVLDESFAADKNTIYYNGRPIPGSDGATATLDTSFQLFRVNTVKDKNHTYAAVTFGTGVKIDGKHVVRP